MADYDFMAVWTPNCMYQPYWVRGSKGYLVHIAHIPALLWNQNRVNGLVWDSVITTNEGGLWQIMISWQFGPCTLCTGHIGSGGTRAIWYTQLIYPLLWNEKSRLLPSLGFPRSHIEGVPLADYAFMAVWTTKYMYQPYWVRGSKGHLVHIAHIPALLWNQNRVYGLVWDTVVPATEGFPVADYDFMAVQTLYCMYRPYRICGSKGCLIHKAHIPPAVELKVAYMAKFCVPPFP